MAEFALYSYFRSSASHRVRIALYLKQIPFEYRAVNLLKGAQKDSSYETFNPSHQVPTLVHNGRFIGQSMAILDYLDHVKPEPRLFPVDSFQRALTIQACEIVNSGVQPLHNLSVLQELEARFGIDQGGKDSWSQLWLGRGLDALEALLKPHAGAFALGDQVSAADCFLAGMFSNLDRYHLTLKDHPALAKIRKTLDAHEAFKKAHPSAQPDTPPPAPTA